MNILVFGAGSIGSLMGAILSREHNVCLLGRQEHVDVVNREGLRVVGTMEGMYAPLAVSSSKDVPWCPDIVLLTVKAHSTENACLEIARTFDSCPVVTFQNGLGNVETMKKILWQEGKVVGGVTSMGAMLVNPGVVSCAGKGKTIVKNGVDMVETVCTSLQRNGFPSVSVEDVTPHIWEKLAVNMLINYIAGLGRVENGRVGGVLECCEGFTKGLLEEIALVSKYEGVLLRPDVCLEKALWVARDTAGNRCSLLRDIESNRRTENQAMAGELLERGRKKGLSLPHTEILYHLVCLAEGTTDK